MYHSSLAVPSSQLWPHVKGKAALTGPRILFQPLFSLYFLHVLCVLAVGRHIYCFLICKMESIAAQCCNTSAKLIYAASLISSTYQLSGLCENLDSLCVGLEKSNRWEESVSATQLVHKVPTSQWVMWSEKGCGHSINFKLVALSECCHGWRRSVFRAKSQLQCWSLWAQWMSYQRPGRWRKKGYLSCSCKKEAAQDLHEWGEQTIFFHSPSSITSTFSTGNMVLLLLLEKCGMGKTLIQTPFCSSSSWISGTSIDIAGEQKWNNLTISINDRD